MSTARCPACGGERIPRKYLCFDCWWGLPRETRLALMKRDVTAMARLQKLYEELKQGTSLPLIRIKP